MKTAKQVKQRNYMLQNWYFWERIQLPHCFLFCFTRSLHLVSRAMWLLSVHMLIATVQSGVSYGMFGTLTTGRRRQRLDNDVSSAALSTFTDCIIWQTGFNGLVYFLTWRGKSYAINLNIYLLYVEDVGKLFSSRFLCLSIFLKLQKFEDISPY